MVQRLRLHLPVQGGWVAKIPHAPRPKKQNIKQKPYCKKNSVKTLEMVQMKKKILKNKGVKWSALLASLSRLEK